MPDHGRSAEFSPIDGRLSSTGPPLLQCASGHTQLIRSALEVILRVVNRDAHGSVFRRRADFFQARAAG